MWKQVQLLWTKSNRWHRVLFLFLIVELRLLPGGQIGFTCNDPALSHPYTGDTISWKWLIGVTLFLPLVVMLLVERQQDKSEAGKSQALFWYKEYFYGTLLNLTIVQALKLIVGSPRPHFFDTCNPKEALTCQGSEYVSSYTCTKAHWLNQSDKSFPSGHTSLAVHAGVFIAYYLHQRCARTRAAACAQAACALSAAACGVSRMCDHRHHWWDVLAGAALSAPILFYIIFTSCKNFKPSARRVDDCDQLNESQPTENQAPLATETKPNIL